MGLVAGHVDPIVLDPAHADNSSDAMRGSNGEQGQSVLERKTSDVPHIRLSAWLCCAHIPPSP